MKVQGHVKVRENVKKLQYFILHQIYNTQYGLCKLIIGCFFCNLVLEISQISQIVSETFSKNHCYANN
jgi:hypothetical protein